jgi:hypothetical protein
VMKIEGRGDATRMYSNGVKGQSKHLSRLVSHHMIRLPAANLGGEDIESDISPKTIQHLDLSSSAVYGLLSHLLTFNLNRSLFFSLAEWVESC